MITEEQAAAILAAKAQRDCAVGEHTRDYDHAIKVAVAQAVLEHTLASAVATDTNRPDLQAAADANLAAALAENDDAPQRIT